MNEAEIIERLATLDPHSREYYNLKQRLNFLVDGDCCCSECAPTRWAYDPKINYAHIHREEPPPYKL